jgi:DNA-binding FrmR family transcriptional regulator
MKKRDHTHLLITRLNRAEGQIRALKRMLAATEPVNCKNFITQVKAARSALKAVSEQFIVDHLHTCQQLPAKERDEQMTEAIKLLSRD